MSRFSRLTMCCRQRSNCTPEREPPERATQAFNEISYTVARQQADIMGAGVYAWADMGPHPETYWLGYAVGASAAWHPGSPDPQELTHSFYDLFYGEGATEMGRLYQLMSTQAQFFAAVGTASPRGRWCSAYSYGIGPFTPHHETLPLPAVPSADYLRLRHELASGQCSEAGTSVEVSRRE